MEWDEFESIIDAANLESTLYSSEWTQLQKAFNTWKEKKEEENRLNSEDRLYGDE
mgnify:CR=1 FL=1